MGFEITSRMKLSVVQEKLHTLYGVSLAVAFEDPMALRFDKRFSDISPKKNGVVRVRDNMTVKEFCDKMNEQFGGSTSLLFRHSSYCGFGYAWYSLVPNEHILKTARENKNGDFVYGNCGCLGWTTIREEDKFQEFIAGEHVDIVKKETWTTLEEKVKLCYSMNSAVESFLDGSLRHAKEIIEKNCSMEKLTLIDSRPYILDINEFIAKQLIDDFGKVVRKMDAESRDKYSIKIKSFLELIEMNKYIDKLNQLVENPFYVEKEEEISDDKELSFSFSKKIWIVIVFVLIGLIGIAMLHLWIIDSIFN